MEYLQEGQHWGNLVLQGDGGGVGIGTTTPKNELDVYGSLAIGSYAGTNAATANGIIVSGNVGIGTTTPDVALTVDGTAPIAEIRSGGYLQLRPAANGWDMRLQAVGQQLEIFSGGNLTTPIMSLVNGGNVGIGTTTPGYPLDVEISYAVPSGYSGYGALYAGGSSSSASTYISGNSGAGVGVSIHSAGRITAPEVDATSDRRIKDVIGISDPAADLKVLKKIEVTDFRYKDRIAMGGHSKKGFIAQQVETVFPEAIHQMTDFIPDVYATSLSSCFDPSNHTLTIRLTKPHNLAKGDKVKIMAGSEKKEVVVNEVISDTQFSVGGWDKPADNVFVYGREVSDFRVVDYDRVYTLNVSATQELSKKLDEAQAQIDLLKTENACLRSTTDHQSEMMQNMKAQMDAINEKLDIRTDR